MQSLSGPSHSRGISLRKAIKGFHLLLLPKMLGEAQFPVCLLEVASGNKMVGKVRGVLKASECNVSVLVTLRMPRAFCGLVPVYSLPWLRTAVETFSVVNYG